MDIGVSQLARPKLGGRGRRDSWSSGSAGRVEKIRQRSYGAALCPSSWMPTPLNLEVVLLPFHFPHQCSFTAWRSFSLQEANFHLGVKDLMLLVHAGSLGCATTFWMPLLTAMENVEIRSSLHIADKQNVQENVCSVFKVRDSGDGQLGAFPL